MCRLGVTDLIDLNNVPNNKPCDNSENEVIDLSNDEQETITIKNCFEPFIRQCVLNEEEAFGFYENYAKGVGSQSGKIDFLKKKNGMIHIGGIFSVTEKDFQKKKKKIMIHI